MSLPLVLLGTQGLDVDIRSHGRTHVRYLHLSRSNFLMTNALPRTLGGAAT